MEPNEPPPGSATAIHRYEVRFIAQFVARFKGPKLGLQTCSSVHSLVRCSIQKLEAWFADL